MSSYFDSETESVEFENLAKLAENIVYLLPGCADLMIRKTIQDVYRDFCRRACCLCARRHLPLTNHIIPVNPLFGGVVDCVVGVYVDRHKLEEGRDYVVSTGFPIFIDINPRFVPNEPLDDFRFVDIDVLEMPSITSENAPTHIINKYGEFIIDGVLSRLQMMTGRAWTDTAQASVRNIRYENGISEARMRYHAGSLNGTGAIDFLPDSSGLI